MEEEAIRADFAQSGALWIMHYVHGSNSSTIMAHMFFQSEKGSLLCIEMLGLNEI